MTCCKMTSLCPIAHYLIIRWLCPISFAVLAHSQPAGRLHHPWITP
jgi:hypothetical protein